MSLWNRINEKLTNDLSVHALMRLVLLLLVVLLLQLTSGFWKGLVMTVWSIIRPFVFGFVIAYIIRDPIRFGENHEISRRISVPVLYIILFGLLIWLGASLVPVLFNRLSDFLNSMIGGVNWIYDFLSEHTGANYAWMNNFFSTSIETLTDMQALLPGFSAAIPDLLTSFIGTFVTVILSIVISIFMCFEWEKIRYYTVVYSLRISRRFYRVLFAVNDDLSDYIRSLIILMAVRFVEYSMLYLGIGHPDWLILAIATAVSLIMPYIGPTAVNVIAILSALQLPGSRVIFLIAMICLLSQLDEYVITPMVHSRNLNLSPLWTLFSIFCASTLFGLIGFVIAVPSYLIIRVIIRQNIQEEAFPEDDNGGTQ